ncbi:MAG: acyltransferase [Chloroflexota bacterium]|nr:acyltransferase [Chloroflexota bacterium]
MRSRRAMLEYARRQAHFIHLRLGVAQLAARILPNYTFSSVRAGIYRWAGLDIAQGVHFHGVAEFTGGSGVYTNLHIGPRSAINRNCQFDLGGEIVIGADVDISNYVHFITTSHEFGRSARRAGALTTGRITVGDGAWIGQAVIIQPGVTVGKSAVILSGAVVTRDVPQDAVYGGNPAREITSLTERLRAHDAKG